MKLIVGLGNPGKSYEFTRHNIGFMVIDHYLNNEIFKSKFNGLYIEKNINGEKVIFLKPQTYMNNSGLCVREFVDYFDISIKDILIIQDDLDESVGKYKIKQKSSSGGHNGIKSIINSLNSEEFARLKIGIKTEKKDDVIDFVLGKLSKTEMASFMENVDIFCEIIYSFIKNGIDKTMNVYNKK